MAELVRRDGGVAFEDGPDRGRILVSGADTGGRYSLMEYVVAPRPPQAAPGFGPHLHAEIEETFLVRSGELQFLLGAEVTTLSAGDFIRVPPGTRHGYANVSTAPVELLITFHPGGFEQLFVKYRTDGGDPAGGEGFLAEATQRFASRFE
ncbi:cupin domain-containing protein [uncultured Phenylobacterium sp.]|uniref:cupin domain-containing protein n=1 Tax=uncultured Phenylobacterium sp. TaxID=349273 RepID=UPI0025D29421|nr:cupin domain-containing protein [uncultured Phenylobacterium sp.]